MKTPELKKDITQFINNIEDENTLLAIRYFLHSQIYENKIVDFWDELPEKVKESINIGLEQAEQGLFIPHNEVMQNIKSKYLE